MYLKTEGSAGRNFCMDLDGAGSAAPLLSDGETLLEGVDLSVAVECGSAFISLGDGASAALSGATACPVLLSAFLLLTGSSFETVSFCTPAAFGVISAGVCCSFCCDCCCC